MLLRNRCEFRKTFAQNISRIDTSRPTSQPPIQQRNVDERRTRGKSYSQTELQQPSAQLFREAAATNRQPMARRPTDRYRTRGFGALLIVETIIGTQNWLFWIELRIQQWECSFFSSVAVNEKVQYLRASPENTGSEFVWTERERESWGLNGVKCI